MYLYDKKYCFCVLSTKSGIMKKTVVPRFALHDLSKQNLFEDPKSDNFINDADEN